MNSEDKLNTELTEERKSGILTKVFIVLAFISGIFALIISIFPLRIFALLPAGFGLLVSLIAYFQIKKNKNKNTKAFISGGISVLVIIAVLFIEIAFPKEIAKDEEFELKIESSENNAEESFESIIKEDSLSVDDIFDEEDNDSTVETEEVFVEEEIFDE